MNIYTVYLNNGNSLVLVAGNFVWRMVDMQYQFIFAKKGVEFENPDDLQAEQKDNDVYLRFTDVIAIVPQDKHGGKGFSIAFKDGRSLHVAATSFKRISADRINFYEGEERIKNLYLDTSTISAIYPQEI
jgi:hypothetical protein